MLLVVTNMISVRDWDVAIWYIMLPSQSFRIAHLETPRLLLSASYFLLDERDKTAFPSFLVFCKTSPFLKKYFSKVSQQHSMRWTFHLMECKCIIIIQRRELQTTDFCLLRLSLFKLYSDICLYTKFTSLNRTDWETVQKNNLIAEFSLLCDLTCFMFNSISSSQ